ncbi:MAG TPA: OPT family oligopeptide transporter [bacterium]|jgi:uncharacterized oligopeptide transporter (OPT) family protein
MPDPAAVAGKKVEGAPPEDGVLQRDLDWLKNVYQGDSQPQLTARAIISGMIFGGIMSVSNLYIGLKSGWGLGVDIAAIIIMFALFKAFKGMGLVKKEFGMMESTIMMTAAVAASWISSAGLVSAVPALTMLTGYQFVWWQLTLLIGIILYSGLFMAIPFKRQMIQVDHLRFPGNVPTGETLKAMYSAGGDAMKKAKALGFAGLSGIVLVLFRDILAPMTTAIGSWMKPQYALPLRIKGVSLSKLTLTFEPSFIFVGIGALMGIKVGMSMLVGFLFNYAVLAPNLINAKIIHHYPPQVTAVAQAHAPMAMQNGSTFMVVLEEATKGPEMADGSRLDTFRYTWTQPAQYKNLQELKQDLNAPKLLDGTTPNPLYGVISVRDTLNKSVGGAVLLAEASKAINWEARLSFPANQDPAMLKDMGFDPETANMRTVGGFRNISAWSLWPGATVLVVGGLLALAFQWRTLGRTFGSIFSSFGKKAKNGKKGPLDDIEIPMSWFVPGFLITGLASIVLLMWMFNIHWYMGAIAVLLTFFLAAVAARAGAEIGINPIGALGKVTQLTFGAISPGNMTTNLMTASVTAGAAASCSDTVGNLFVGYMVGANPRKQFIAQLFGVISGAFMAVPAYFLLVPDASILGGDKFPAPSALVWQGVAKVLAKGLSTLPPSAVVAIIVAFVLGVTIVILDRMFPKIKPYTPSPAALGIAMTINGYTSFSMFLGAAIVWVLERKAAKWNDMNTVPIASGWIAGESIMGVVVALLMYLGFVQ